MRIIKWSHWVVTRVNRLFFKSVLSLQLIHFVNCQNLGFSSHGFLALLCKIWVIKCLSSFHLVFQLKILPWLKNGLPELWIEFKLLNMIERIGVLLSDLSLIQNYCLVLLERLWRITLLNDFEFHVNTSLRLISNFIDNISLSIAFFDLIPSQPQ